MMKYCTRDGVVTQSDTGQDRLLSAIYKSVLGRMAIRPLTAPVISVCVGHFLDSPLSKMLIKPFIKSSGIDMSIYEEREFCSYNDFFTRKVKPQCRPVDMDSSHIISPCDAKISAYPIKDGSIFHIKSSSYSIESLTHSKKLAKKYANGTCVILRLAVDDYHRYIYLDTGVKSKNYVINGCLHTVNPAAVEQVPVYKENTRQFCLIHTQHFGDILQMEVGAMMVGRICNHHMEACAVTRGQEKGCFEFGGSTIVLLFENGKAVIDEDLFKNTENGCETVVRMGEAIGHKP